MERKSEPDDLWTVNKALGGVDEEDILTCRGSHSQCP
jgi:hypothetical protein